MCDFLCKFTDALNGVLKSVRREVHAPAASKSFITKVMFVKSLLDKIVHE